MASAALIATGLIVLPAAVYPQYHTDAAFFHAYMPDGTLVALEWIGQNTSPDDVIAVDGPTAPRPFSEHWVGTTMGWWVEGYANRHAVYEGNPFLLPFGSLWDSTRNATRLFAGRTVLEDGILRVADNFPVDDSAGPRVLVGYGGDYREIVNFAEPTLVDRAQGLRFPLQMASPSNDTVSANTSAGVLTGTYAAAGLQGNRSVRLDGVRHLVALRIELTVDPQRGWSAFELAMPRQDWTQLDVSQLEVGVVKAAIADGEGLGFGKGAVRLSAQGLGPVELRPGPSLEASFGYQLSWPVTSDHFAVDIEFAVEGEPYTAPGAHGVRLYTQEAVVSRESVDYLFVAAGSPLTLRRLDAEPSRFARVFENNAAVIFQVL